MVTMVIWSVLPHVLKVLVGRMDPASITWYRFAIASVGFGGLVVHRGGLPRLGHFGRIEWALLASAVLALGANYMGFLVGLDLTSPATSQVLIQLGPLLLAMGGIVIFREQFTPLQWLGFAVLLCGLALFFSSQIDQLADRVQELVRYREGALAIVFAAVTWAGYCLAQKQLLVSIPSQPLMLCLFLGCTVLFTPLVDHGSVLELDAVGLVALALSAFATACAYGCFSASLEHLEASRVSAVIALVPLGTLASSSLLTRFDAVLFPPIELPLWSLAGATAVVAGSLLTSLGGRSEALVQADRN